jgi:alkanesulfonate monooxygenase SsuD/methylene tetrahydromethanopterin reductase-like flavin-dependent oxidoreductase (luciferase family)
MHTRGKRFDALLEDLTRVWSGEPRGFAGPIGPAPTWPGGPPLLFGGTSEAALRRTVRYGAGWISGGGGLQNFAQMAARVRQAWTAAGREGVPRLAALTYYALGPDAADRARAYLMDYYAVSGPYAERIASSANVTPDLVRQTVQQFQSAGCDELILFPCDASVDQVERLREVVA